MACPYFDFKANHVFISKNGVVDDTNDKWVEEGDSIKIYSAFKKTINFKIETEDSSTMCLCTKDMDTEGVVLKFYLSKKCSDIGK